MLKQAIVSPTSWDKGFPRSYPTARFNVFSKPYNTKSGLTTPFILGKAGGRGEKTPELEKGVIKADLV
jgi:hypothetical protein